MRKGISKAGKRVRNMPTLTIRSPTKHQANRHQIYEENLVQINAGPMVDFFLFKSVSPSEPCLLDSIGHVFLISSLLFDSYNIFYPSSEELPDL